MNSVADFSAPNARFTNPGTQHGEPMLPVLESLERWRTAQHCATAPDTIYSREEGSITGLRWRSPDGKGDVVLYTSTTGGHQWPQWRGFGAARVIWDFFKNVPAR